MKQLFQTIGATTEQMDAQTFERALGALLREIGDTALLAEYEQLRKEPGR